MQSCFFTGHRNAPSNALIVAKTGDVIIDLITKKGVTNFYAGGAIGWDTTCESLILSLKGIYPQIRLNIILPCPPEIQSAKWNDEQKEKYNRILKAANSIEIVSRNQDNDCTKKRNARLVELGDICLCYYNEKNFRSGTGKTVRMAQKAEKQIINMYDLSQE